MSTTINVSKDDRILTVTPRGKVDSQVAPQLGAALNEALNEQPSWVIIDLHDVPFISSDGLRYLVTTSQKVSRNLIVVGLNSRVRQVFELTGLDHLMSLCCDMDAARKTIQSTSNAIANAG